jgi:hypothetical protein
MIALACDWSGDLSVGPSGDISVAPARMEIRQRIVRRLLTNPGDYIWHSNYGAGLGKFVGEPYSPDLVESTIAGQLRNESLIASVPAPVVRADAVSPGLTAAAAVTIEFQVVGAIMPSTVALNVG